MKALFAGLLLTGALIAPLAAGAQEAESAGEDSAPAIVQTYQPDPAIWLLSDEDTSIYLLGTIHVLPEGFRWRSPLLDGIVAEADELIVESTEGEPAEAALLAGLMGSIEKRPTVSKRLSPANRPKWLALGESAGMPPEYFDRLPPVLAMFGLASGLSRQETGSTVEFGVETVLEAEFGAAGKPIGAIESGAAVLAALLAIDEALLIKELDRELSRWNGKSFETLFEAVPTKASGPAARDGALGDEHAWAQGREIDVGPDLAGDGMFGRVMAKVLLDNRNRAWAGWLEQRLAEPGTVLVAVGAGHLAGTRSLQVMLAERGLAAERVN
jgi:uncharacterized protein YbaP (TraB family)